MISTKRYKENPSYLFFEYYILDTIGLLSTKQHEEIEKLDIGKLFEVESNNWKEIIHKALKLSETIDFSILDLWYINRERLLKKEIEYNPVEYAVNFVDEYYKEKSLVDKWTDKSILETAKRISKNHKKYQKKIEKAKKMLESNREIEEIKKKTKLYESEIELLS